MTERIPHFGEIYDDPPGEPGGWPEEVQEAIKGWFETADIRLAVQGLQKCPRACHGFGRCPKCHDTGYVPLSAVPQGALRQEP